MGLECRDVGLVYPARTGEIRALDRISFRVAEHEFVCLVGPSGCGKTTLLKIVAGLLSPSSGEIRYRIPGVDGAPRCAMAFQEHGVFPWMTVLENVAFGLEMRGVPRAERRSRALSFIEQVGLAPFTDNYPHELSVGMRQRVSIARAFATDPEVLLMDEPFGSIDAMTKMILQQELLRIWFAHRKMVLYVTHDIEEAVLLADRVLVMTGRPGRILEEIPVPLPRPRDPRDRDAAESIRIKEHVWSLLEKEVAGGLVRNA
ncbi:MAG: ABC transporter ATP-binding protein [Candidatus Latescibacterota bacterium]|nr:MAG: ABC transporter ATP-binding protein [Candidatus Latescibacterota bacterium]